MQKMFLKLKAYKNDNPKGKGPRYSRKKLQIAEQVVIEAGTYDLDVFFNIGEAKPDERGNKREYEYMNIELKEPWQKESQAAELDDPIETPKDKPKDLPF
jgi:hypothetical protein